MAKQTIGQKANRTLRLLMGLRDPRVTRAMVAHGFTPGDLQDGLQRLGGLTGMRLDSYQPTKDRGLVARLDEFENTWFPVARATLEARYPEIGQVLFRNLVQYTGPAVVVSVSTFLKRLAQMEKGEGDFGNEGAAARALLEQRGITGAKIMEAQACLQAMATIAEEPSVTGPSAAEQQAAEDHMWAWYLEWSAIARVAVKDGRLLRGMGLGHRARKSEAEGGEVTPEVPALPAAPALAADVTPLLTAAAE